MQREHVASKLVVSTEHVQVLVVEDIHCVIITRRRSASRRREFLPNECFQVENEEVIQNEVALAAVHEKVGCGGLRGWLLAWSGNAARHGWRGPRHRLEIEQVEVVQALSASRPAKDEHLVAAHAHMRVLARRGDDALHVRLGPRPLGALRAAHVEDVQIVEALALAAASAEHDERLCLGVVARRVCVARARRAWNLHEFPVHAVGVDVPQLAALDAVDAPRASEHQDDGRAARRER